MCSQFASGSGAGDHQFKDLYDELNRNQRLFEWPFVLEEASDDDQEGAASDPVAAAAAADSEAAATALAAAANAAATAAATAAAAAAAATAEREAQALTDARVASLRADGLILRAAARQEEPGEPDNSSRGWDGFIEGQGVRQQVGADLSLSLGSPPAARSEGSAINPPQPGRARCAPF